MVTDEKVRRLFEMDARGMSRETAAAFGLALGIYVSPLRRSTEAERVER